MQVPQRRTIIVLGSLITAMTASATLLLALESTQVREQPLHSLGSVDISPVDELFNTRVPIDETRWTRVEIDFSGTRRGSAATLHQLHRRLGVSDGLAYHFVVGNGDGMGDGEIQIGFRWRDQLPSVLPTASGRQDLRPNAITVCVIGRGPDGRPTDRQITELTWLVRQLQRQLGISAQQVYVPSMAFPETDFRQQLFHRTF